MQAFAFGLPVIERSGDANGFGCRMNEFKADGHELKPGVWAVVVVVIVFHG
jgi:hypothetical protein